MLIRWVWYRLSCCGENEPAKIVMSWTTRWRLRSTVLPRAWGIRGEVNHRFLRLNSAREVRVAQWEISPVGRNNDSRQKPGAFSNWLLFLSLTSPVFQSDRAGVSVSRWRLRSSQRARNPPSPLWQFPENITPWIFFVLVCVNSSSGCVVELEPQNHTKSKTGAKRFA